MAKLGFSPEQADELEMETVTAFMAFQNAEYEIEWDHRVKVLGKMFGGNNGFCCRKNWNRTKKHWF